MMIIARPEKKTSLIKGIKEAGIPVAEIGRITDASLGCMLVGKQGTTEIEPPGSDELYQAVFEN
jgi:hydrogenase maturation factor HypE